MKVQILLSFVYLGLLVIIGQLLYNASRIKHIKNQPFLNYIRIKRFSLTFAFGLLIWLILSILKRLFPTVLYGYDYLILSLIYSSLIIAYYKNREFFSVLPGGLKYLVVNSKKGTHLLDYDFKLREIRFSQPLLEDHASLHILRNLVPNTKKILENAIAENKIGSSSSYLNGIKNSSTRLESQTLTNLSFQGNQMLFFSSKNFQCILFLGNQISQYHKTLKRNTEKMEDFVASHHWDVEEINNSEQSKLEFQKWLKSEWDKYY